MVEIDRQVTKTGSNSCDLSLTYAWIFTAAIVIFSILVLSPALKVYFHGDDFSSLNAPSISGIGDLPEVIRYASVRASRFMHLGIYFSLGKSLWGLNPVHWHFSSLILFAIDTFLLFALLLRASNDRLASVIGTGIFALSGALFYAQVWITGTVELLASLFVFSSTLMHLKALDISVPSQKRIAFETIAIILLCLAFATKETMLPIIIVWILIDIFTKRKLTAGGIGAVVAGIGGAVLGMMRISRLQHMESYGIVTNPLTLLINLFAYFYDPVAATGGESWFLYKIGAEDGTSGTVRNLSVIARDNIALSILFFIVILAIAVLFVFFTFRTGKSHETDKPKSGVRLPRFIGWAGWFVLLIPAIVTPGHHFPYYVTVPLAFLVISIGPALASGLRNPRSRNFIVIALLIYAIWFPINTNLAFKFSPLTRGAVETKKLVEAIGVIYPERPEGMRIIIDGVEPSLQRAMAYGYAVEWNYPEVKALPFRNFRKTLEEHKSDTIIPGLKRVVIRRVDGVWTDVTNEFVLPSG